MIDIKSTIGRISYLVLRWWWVAIPSSIMLLMVVIFPSGLSEDAFIILRYVRNITDGHGFVWNPGEDPVWGSTSLLWTLSLVLCGILGMNLVVTAQILNIILGIVLILIICMYTTIHFEVPRIYALIASVIFSVSTVVGQVLTGFDVMLYSVMLLLTYILSRRSIHSKKEGFANHLPLVVVCFLIGITRPEGMIVGALTIIIVFLRKSDITILERIKTFIVPYSIMLGIFAITTLFYFGSILPNPFLIKSTGVMLNEASARLGLSFLIDRISLLCIVALCAWLLSLHEHEIFNELLLLIPPFAAYIGYFFVTQYQNVIFRFQFPILPLLFLLFPLGLRVMFKIDGLSLLKIRELKIPQKSSVLRNIVILSLIGIMVVSQYGETRTQVPYVEGTDKAVVGRFLSQYQHNGYTIVVSEAGMIPYYSQWRTIDAFGLNDPNIANNGLTEEYLLENNPEVIQFHEFYTNATTEWNESDNRWHIMTWMLRTFCFKYNYTLAAIISYRTTIAGVPGSESYQWYFVRGDFTHSSEIITGIQTLPGIDYAYPEGVKQL